MFTFNYIGIFKDSVSYHVPMRNGHCKAYIVVNNKLKYLCTIPF
jgi:hypothetical protein